MFTTLIAKTTAPDTSAVRQSPHAGRKAHSEEELHISALVFGLIDARVCPIDFLDTPGGDELLRLYRRRHPGRRHVRH